MGAIFILLLFLRNKLLRKEKKLYKR